MKFKDLAIILSVIIILFSNISYPHEENDNIFPRGIGHMHYSAWKTLSKKEQKLWCDGYLFGFSNARLKSKEQALGLWDEVSEEITAAGLSFDRWLKIQLELHEALNTKTWYDRDELRDFINRQYLKPKFQKEKSLGDIVWDAHKFRRDYD
jgi:hypothetical protein